MYQREPRMRRAGRRPRVAAHRRTAPAHGQYDPMQQSAHILVVEDDADIRRMIAEFLRRNGYRVQTAREGGELDRILEVSRIDLLILDIGLPQEDGLSVCRRIRTQSSVPIIMLT